MPHYYQVYNPNIHGFTLETGLRHVTSSGEVQHLPLDGEGRVANIGTVVRVPSGHEALAQAPAYSKAGIVAKLLAKHEEEKRKQQARREARDRRARQPMSVKLGAVLRGR